jgi:carboxyl-terminal processing protease
MRNLSKPSKDYKQSIIFGALMGMGIALVFAAGFFVRDLVPMPRVFSAPASSSEASYVLLFEVQGLLDNYYLRDQPSASEREYAAIRGMLASLEDRYTFFIDPPVAQSESQVLAGTYGGIGVLLQRNENGQIVMIPFDDSPAQAAGIEDGDVLLAINDTPVDLTIPSDQLDQMLRGEVKENSGVEVTVEKRATGEEETVFIPFAVINVPSVIWRVLPEDEHIGYVQVLRFTSRTPEELQDALTQLKDAQITDLVLDLRNNGGGLLEESVDVADEFIDDGVIAYERNRTEETPFNGEAGGAGLELPLIVLVNQGTASGAELVAGALQDTERAMLIGQKTYGKGTIQQIYPLSDGSSLHVTAAEWLTPSKQPLNGTGLEPDITMIPDANGRDVELGEAIRQLQTIRAEQGE